MAEDKGLCTYEKHHKQKILLFLSSMRSYADALRKNKFKLDYFKIEDKEFNDDYLKKLKKIIIQKKVKEISSFEVEDKFFEKKISQFLKKEKINWNVIQTPMFLNSRAEFKNYLSKSKKPVSIDELQEKVWSYQSDIETHTVETHIYRLRKKILNTFNDNNFIISEKNGYQIK